MTDIVERLRQFADHDVDETARDGTLEAADILRWSALMREAKDEIERLRAAVAQYEFHDLISVPIEPSDEMLDAADSAIPRFEPGPDGIRMMGVDGAALCWEAMIDAIRARMEAKP